RREGRDRAARGGGYVGQGLARRVRVLGRQEHDQAARGEQRRGGQPVRVAGRGRRERGGRVGGRGRRGRGRRRRDDDAVGAGDGVGGEEGVPRGAGAFQRRTLTPSAVRRRSNVRLVAPPISASARTSRRIGRSESSAATSPVDAF